MSSKSGEAAELQRKYYERTAESYDLAHTEREHIVALHLLAAFVEVHGIKSVLDVGAGTGRAMRFLKRRFPDIVVKGIEPVTSLRRKGHDQGIPPDDLIDGDGTRLPFADGSFDLVCEFAVLHHVRRPALVVAEMSRVACRMVAISDCNFMGQGPGWLRVIKLGLYAFGLWPMANLVKTRGKGYTFSEGDGVAYSYTVYQDLPELRRQWQDVRVIATAPVLASLFGPVYSAPHLLVVAQQRERA